MPKYIGVKVVEAEPMSRKAYNDFRGWELPADENGDDPGFLKNDGNGHIQWDPEDAFNRDFRQCDSMTFGHAIEAMKAGHKVGRAGWNGKGMFVVYQKGYPEGIAVNKNTAEAYGVPEGTVMKFRPYMQLKTAQNDCAMWAPSGSDALAEDWCVIE